jgi:predicted O-methyltransferase YrrM
MRTYDDIKAMADQDYSIGLTAHYEPLAELIRYRGFKSIIEIGTAYASNAHYMLSNTKIEHLITIDPYIYYPAMPGFICQEEYDTLREFALQKLMDYWGRVELLRLNSREAFKILDPVDLIFLDGDHGFDTVLWECENYSNLVKPGGVLSGHDYNIFEGVNKAVDEFSKKIGKPVQVLDGNIWYINF